jgi:hypothetical protein
MNQTKCFNILYLQTGEYDLFQKKKNHNRVVGHADIGILSGVQPRTTGDEDCMSTLANDLIRRMDS